MARVQLQSSYRGQIGSLRGGIFKGQEFVLSGDGRLYSQGYATGVTGLILRGDGSAEFNDVVIRGDVESGTWDGASPANLATFDTGATQGFYLDASVGASQWMGDVFIGGDLIMSGTGEFRTGSGSDYIAFGPFGAQPRLMAWIDGGVTQGSIIATAGGDLEISTEIAVGTGILLDAGSADQVRISPKLLLAFGSAGTPSFTFSTDENTGMYRVGSDEIGFSVGGARRFSIANDVKLGVATTGYANLKANATPSATRPAYAFVGDEDTGMYRAGADIVVLAAGTVGVLQVRDVNPFVNIAPGFASGREALKLDIERAWSFLQQGSGASTQLRFYSSSNKILDIGGVTNGSVFVVDSGTLQEVRNKGRVVMSGLDVGTSGVNIDIHSSGDYLLRQSSSERYKNDVRPYVVDGDEIEAWTLWQFEFEIGERAKKDWAERHDAADKETLTDRPPPLVAQWDWGPTAEQMFAVSPHLVALDDEGRPDGVDSRKLIWPVVAYVKASRQRIVELEDQVRKLLVR